MSLTPPLLGLTPPYLRNLRIWIWDNLRSGSRVVSSRAPKPSNLAVSPLENPILRCKIPKFSACGGLLGVKIAFWARRRREKFEKHTSTSDFPMGKRASLQCKIPKFSACGGLLGVKIAFWAHRRRENFEKPTSTCDFPMGKRASLRPCWTPNNTRSDVIDRKGVWPPPPT